MARMPRILVTAGWLAALLPGVAVPAWAQETCADGAPCAAATQWGAWGLIAIGLAFIAVWLMPAPGRREDEVGNAGLPLMRLLQARIQKELTGWRRWQWPVLGTFFIGLGVATLAGWR